MAASRITYEREVCGRCGGSGHYSFNLRHGTVCYGCGGTGKRLSRRGKRARNLVLAKRAELFGCRADEVEAGQRVWIEGFPGCGDIPPMRSAWRTITAVEPGGVSVGRTVRDGVEYVAIHQLVELGHSKDARYVVSAEQQVLVWSDEAWARLTEYAARLKGAEPVDDKQAKEVA